MRAGEWSGLERGSIGRWLPLALVVLLAGACGGSGATPGPGELDASDGLVLQAVGGAYTDGSGRSALAVLLTFRDAEGRGPRDAWSGRVEDSRGPLSASFSYPVATGDDGSFAAYWWPDVGLAEGETYAVVLTHADGRSVQATFRTPSSAGLAAPQVDLSADGARLTWTQVEGAQSYGCQVYAEGALQLGTTGTTTQCDVSALPAGTYAAAVTALSASWEGLRADATQRPQLPGAFHVSESGFAFARGPSGASARASASGGAFYYGRVQPGLALWAAVARGDGTPFDTAAQLEVVGPGLRADAPLRFTYPANTPRHLVWSYDALALEGQYTVTIRVAGQVLSTRFSIGPPQPLSAPDAVAAVPGNSGAASVSWRPVTGARSYYVSAWDVAGGFATGRWTASTSVAFTAGTFVAGHTYDVYVAATDVDVTSPLRPERLSVAENTYLPATFTAK